MKPIEKLPISADEKIQLSANNSEYWLAQKLITPFHDSVVTTRRHKVLRNVITKLLPKQEKLQGIDIGCGTGALGQSICEQLPDLEMIGIDVHLWTTAVIPVVQYDGLNIPFEDKSFDFTMLVDVLHHCDDMESVLQEAVRVSRKFIIIKDHLCESVFDSWSLRFMDWFGNKGYGVALPHRYLSLKEWRGIFSRLGLRAANFQTDLHIYPAPFSWLFDRELHFVAKLAIE